MMKEYHRLYRTTDTLMGNMSRKFPLWILGIAFLQVSVLTAVPTAAKDSLFQRHSLQSPDFRTICGQEPRSTLIFDSSDGSSCRSSKTFFVSSPDEASSLNLGGQAGREGNFITRGCRYGFRQVCSDYRNLYNRDAALNWGVALAGTAILANTAMDRHFVDWYQDDVRSSGTDDFAKFWKTFGEGGLFIPIFAVSAVSYRFYEQSAWNRKGERRGLGEYAVRTTRGYFVGFPALLVFQTLLGESRPAYGEKASYWRPFHNDNSVSGHAFIGAMPFITAAQMVEKPWLKGVFYACSVLPAWSRVNDNDHFLSQAILGWYLAYLSARAVSKTDGAKLPKGLTIFPVTEGRYVGLGFLYKR